MKLRALALEDAPFMLEWMHDIDVVEKMDTDFATKTLYDCENFIRQSWKTKDINLHLAVVDEKNIYQGTVSLKHIDYLRKNAEFAIVMRKCAMGKGISNFAMQKILSIGKNKFGLREIYWCVRSDNIRAVHFYDKNNYRRMDVIPEEILSLYHDKSDLFWYIWKSYDN